MFSSDLKQMMKAKRLDEIDYFVGVTILDMLQNCIVEVGNLVFLDFLIFQRKF